MKAKTAKRWFLWHKWTSLICTVLLLLLCVTGLPLIFHEEIEHLQEAIVVETLPGEQRLSFDELVDIAEANNPGKHVRYAFWERNEHPNQVLFDVTENPDDHFEKSQFVLTRIMH